MIASGIFLFDKNLPATSALGSEAVRDSAPCGVEECPGGPEERKSGIVEVSESDCHWGFIGCFSVVVIKHRDQDNVLKEEFL